MEKLSKNKTEKLKYENEANNLVKRYNTKELETKLKINENEIVDKNSNIMKLLESSEYLSNKIISKIVDYNLKDEFPFKYLEVNILLDCAGTITDTEKAHVMLQVCALTTVFYSLEIPYLISVVGDSGFKVVLKKLTDKHSIDYLQKALDCIFIKRYKTNIASCIKTAIDYFSDNDNDEAQRVFYIFTNGFDEELVLHEHLKKKIFNNSKDSFVFIFSKPEIIKDEHSKKLTKFWEEFGKFFQNSNVQYIEMYKEKIYTSKDEKYEILKDNLKKYYEVIIKSLIRKTKNENKEPTKESKFEIDKLEKIQLIENFDNLNNILSNANKYLKVNEEPYIDKIKLEQIQETAKKLSPKEFKEITKNLGSILNVINPVKIDISDFMKTFKIPKERINLSSLEMIFKPNLATQTILTDVGTHIDVNELIKYFLNPSPNPRIYRELGDGFVKNYGVTVIIDSSTSCFSPLYNHHTWSTIQILLISLSAIDLPCFDLIISGNPNPYILCLEKNTLDILSEKSKIWPILFDLLFRNSENTDLASAIRAAYNLHNSRKTDHPDYLFIVTDGFFSSSEIQRIINNVSFCMIKGINIIGIGVGIYPCGIKKLFPNIIYSKNPYKLIQGIASCFSGALSCKEDMKGIKSEFNFNFREQDIIDAQKNPKNRELKTLLSGIMIELSGFGFVEDEIPEDAVGKKLLDDG